MALVRPLCPQRLIRPFCACLPKVAAVGPAVKRHERLPLAIAPNEPGARWRNPRASI